MESFETLTPFQYLSSVERTANSDLSIESQIANCCVSLIEEFGEFAGIIKKHKFHGHDLNLEAVEKELGDTLFYLFWLCRTLSNGQHTAALFVHPFTKPFGKIPVSIMNAGRDSSDIARAFLQTQAELGRLVGKALNYMEYNASSDRYYMSVEAASLNYLYALTSLCRVLDIDSHWGKVAHMNQQKLLKRYPDGFSTTASKTRSE